MDAPNKVVTIGIGGQSVGAPRLTANPRQTTSCVGKGLNPWPFTSGIVLTSEPYGLTIMGSFKIRPEPRLIRRRAEYNLALPQIPCMKSSAPVTLIIVLCIFFILWVTAALAKVRTAYLVEDPDVDRMSLYPVRKFGLEFR